MKYGDIDPERFCEDYLTMDLKVLFDTEGPFGWVRDHVANEIMRLWQRDGIDPVDVLQAVLDKLHADAVIVVNKLPQTH